MPVNPDLYPDNWKAIASSVKEAANWQCRCCGKQCYEPGQRPESLIRREWTANILQVHHKNYDTTNRRKAKEAAISAK